MVVKFNTNINCGNCIRTITPVLNALDNIDSWHVDTDNPNKVLTAELDDENSKAVLDAVKLAGFEISLID